MKLLIWKGAAAMYSRDKQNVASQSAVSLSEGPWIHIFYQIYHPRYAVTT